MSTTAAKSRALGHWAAIAAISCSCSATEIAPPAAAPGGGKTDSVVVATHCDDLTLQTGDGPLSVEEHYLPQVLACEHYDAAPAALRALAVAARTFVYYRLSSPNPAERVLHGDARDQRYYCREESGAPRHPGPQHVAAVRDTAGEVLTHRGRLVASMYRAGSPYLDARCLPLDPADPRGGQPCVTYNAQRRGPAVIPGGRAADGTDQRVRCSADPDGPANRGILSQHGANCLAGGVGRDGARVLYGASPEAGSSYRDPARRFTYEQILAFFYGADATLVQATGCVRACSERPLLPEHAADARRLTRLLDAGVLPSCAGRPWGGHCKVTRAELMEMLLRGQGYDVLAGAMLPALFADVANDHPFAPAIKLAQAYGVTLGCGSGLFCPDEHATREQLATLVSRQLEHLSSAWAGREVAATPRFPDVQSGYADSLGGTRWSFAHIQKLADAGLVAAGADGEFEPKALVTRAEAARLIFDALALVGAFGAAGASSARRAPGCDDRGDGQAYEGFGYPVGDRSSWPAGGWRVSQVLGQVNHQRQPPGHHLAQDVLHPDGGEATVGQPVYSVGSGTVLYAKRAHTSTYRYAVLIRHPLIDGSSVCSFYGHVDRPLIAAGDPVRRGQQIATVASWADCVRGGSPAVSHLHYALLDERLCAHSARSGDAGYTLLCGYDRDIEPLGYTHHPYNAPARYSSRGDECGNAAFSGGFLSPSRFIDEHHH